MRRMLLLCTLALCFVLSTSFAAFSQLAVPADPSQPLQGIGLFCDTAEQIAVFVDQTEAGADPEETLKAINSAAGGSGQACGVLAAEYTIVKEVGRKTIPEVGDLVFLEVSITAGFNQTTREWQLVDPPLTQYAVLLKPKA